MPTTTYTPIASITLAATATEVVFSGLPQTFRDLILVINHGTSASPELDVRFNADSGANYAQVVMAGGDSSPVSASSSGQTQIRAFYNVSTTRQLGVMQIMDYSVTDKHKTALLRHGLGNTDNVVARAARWSNTAAITSISLTVTTGNIAIGSTFNLFGIVA
jgi:hypothetical protein